MVIVMTGTVIGINIGITAGTICVGHRDLLDISRHLSGWSEGCHNKGSIQLTGFPAEIRIGCLLNTS